jgi:hypothetical protein
MTEHTIKSLIGSGLVIQALEQLEVPLGGALVINVDGDNDGTATWNMEAPDFPDVLSKLVGIAIAHHAVETMVMPSNADRLDDVREFLKAVVNSPNVSRPLLRDGTFTEQFEDFLCDIESVQQNLRAHE